MTLKQAIDIVQQLIAHERFAEAQQMLESIDAAAPGQASVVYGMGVIAEAEGRMTDAVRHMQRAVSQGPDAPIMHWGLALTLLVTGQLERGWKEFEWRTKVPGWTLGRDFAQPQWTGQEVRGKTVLLHAEGGQGDAIQFCRYVPAVAKRGATVVLECQQSLVALLSRLPGLTATIPRGQPLPPFDYHRPLQGLPMAFGTTLETIPSHVPYLSAPPELVRAWRQKVGGAAHIPSSGTPGEGKGGGLPLRIGLAWAGSNTPDNRRSRTVSIFAPLASIDAVEFHSLQTGPEAREMPPPGLRLIDHADELRDFAQTAALMENLDLVISVDTSVAHLAGALGKPVWVLVPKVPDFRWLRDRTDSPWYPTMRLFRQQIGAKDWSAVVGAIASALRRRAGP